MKITGMIFGKGEVPSSFKEILIRPNCKRGLRSEYDNYRGIGLLFVGSRLLSVIMPFRLRNAVGKVLK